MSKHLILAIALAAGGNPAGNASSDPIQNPKSKIQNNEDAVRRFEGTWQLVSATKNGRPTPADVVGKIRVVIKDGKHSGAAILDFGLPILDRSF